MLIDSNKNEATILVYIFSDVKYKLTLLTGQTFNKRGRKSIKENKNNLK